MNAFKKNIISIYDRRGQQWLDSLPEIIAKIAEEYHLSCLTPVNNMTFNYVASGYQNDNPTILKIGLDSRALTNEALYLKAFAKHGAPEVIACNDNMIIMQRAVPGHTLKGHFPDNDIDATNILCTSIKALHKASIPANHNFYHLNELFKALDQALDIPDEILAKARHLRDELLKSTTKEVLLHGDLHHDNILFNNRHGEHQRGHPEYNEQYWIASPTVRNDNKQDFEDSNWLVIDPKGLIGDPAFEPAAYLCNPIPELLQTENASKLIADRIKLSSKRLDIAEQRITDWLYVKSVLSWVWCLEDNLNAEYWPAFLRQI